jgi:dTMP kinase
MFVTLEGPEGSGKSGASAWLAEQFAGVVPEILTVREPGGTQVGERIREILLDGQTGLEPMAALLLFEAARAQLLARVVSPALARGALVLCDRYTDSTLAYQAYGEGLSLDVVRCLNEIASGGLVPDLTLLLDLDPTVGLRRRGSTGVMNAIDRRPLAFHERVRAGFLSLARADPLRWRLVNAAQPLETVQRQIAEHVQALYAGAAGET